MICGIAWVWGFMTSEFFPEHASLSLNLVSFTVYLEAATIGAFGLARRTFKGPMKIGLRVGLRVGFEAWVINMVFRFIIFDLANALDGVILFLISFMLGGVLGGLLGGLVRKPKPQEA